MRIECENCNAAYTIGDMLLSDQPIGAQCPYCGHVRIVRRGDPPSLAKKPSLPSAPGLNSSPLSLGLQSKPPPPPSRQPPPSFGPGFMSNRPASSNVDVSDLGMSGPSSGPFTDRFAPPPPAPSAPGMSPSPSGGARCQVCQTELTDEFDKVIGLCETHQRERSGQPDFGSTAGPKASEQRQWRVRALDGTVQGPLTLSELKSGLEDNLYGEEDEFSRDNGDYHSMDKFHELRPYTKAERSAMGGRAAAAPRPRGTVKEVTRPQVGGGGGIGAGTVLLSLLVVALAAAGAYLMMHPELLQGVISSIPANAKSDFGPIPPNPLKRQLDKWRLANPDASGTAEEHLASAQARMLEDNPRGHQQAQEALQRALLLDEDNAVAVAAYAENLVLWKGAMLTEEELLLVDSASRFAVAAKPDSPATQRARAAHGLAIADPNVSRTPAEKALALSPKDGLAKLYLASSYLEGNPQLAIREAETAVEVTPNLRRADRVLARAYANAGRYASAMKRLDKRLEAEPTSASTLWLKADLERELGNNASAKALYTKAVQQEPEDVGPRVALGELLLSMNDPRGATEAYRPVVEGARPLPPKYRLAALAGLARAELSFGRWAKVRELSRAALSIDGRDPAALLAMAEVSLATGSATAAIDHANKALAIRAGEPAVLVVLGRSMLLQKQTEAGIAKLDEATQNDPRNVVLRGILAGGYLSLGGNLQAFTLMRRASEMDPADGASGGRRGLFAVSESAVKEALERFREASKDLPDRSLALSSAGMIQYQLGNTGEARSLMAQALDADDANVGALLYTAQMALDRGAYKEAEELARRMFRVERGSAIGWLTVGRALVGQQKYKEAIEAFDTALRSSRGLLVAEVERAGVKLKQGDAVEAKRVLASAHVRNPHLVRTRRLMLEAGE